MLTSHPVVHLFVLLLLQLQNNAVAICSCLRSSAVQSCCVVIVLVCWSSPGSLFQDHCSTTVKTFTAACHLLYTCESTLCCFFLLGNCPLLEIVPPALDPKALQCNRYFTHKLYCTVASGITIVFLHLRLSLSLCLSPFLCLPLSLSLLVSLSFSSLKSLTAARLLCTCKWGCIKIWEPPKWPRNG